MADDTLEHPNTRLIRDFFTAFGAADRDALTRILAPDAVWTFPGASPIAGAWRGVDGLLDGIRRVAMTLGDGKHGFELLEIFASDVSAVSIHRDYYTGDDDDFDLRYMVHYTIVDGRIVKAAEIPFDQFESDRYWHWRAAQVAAAYAPPL